MKIVDGGVQYDSANSLGKMTFPRELDRVGL
jgi:hypothetical protein